jgi:hypothetical protein
MVSTRPFRDLGQSEISSFSSSSSPRLVDLLKRLRVRAMSGWPVLLLISKMAKDLPVSSLNPPSELLLFILKVYNRSSNSSLLTMVSILCISIDAEDSSDNLPPFYSEPTS